MKFIDEAKIKIKAGDGGKGCTSFRREKYIPRGGPDGGSGGRGGDIIARVNEGLSTLMDFRYRKHFKAPNGKGGRGKNMDGKKGESIILQVPPGTTIYNDKTDEVLADLMHHGDEAVIAQGGRGGLGNSHFATATRQSPDFAQEGEEGQSLNIRLELKLLADVGLVGLPNAGKSTFLTVVSKARPKVADYPFTTLVPSLGVVFEEPYSPFTIADIPGLIKGAHKGEGLGIQFLKHIERTQIFLHLISLSQEDPEEPMERFETIHNELIQFAPEFENREQLIVLTKVDLMADEKEVKKIKRKFEKKGYKVYAISSITKEGVNTLLVDLAKKVQESKEVK